MTHEEIEKAIENGESVWGIYKGQSNVYEIKSNNIEKVFNDTFLWGKEYYSNIKDVYKTKAEAEHYLHHANVTRTEQLPFLTWEEFEDIGYFDFVSADHEKYKLYALKVFNQIILAEYTTEDKDFYQEVEVYQGFNEKNFYKAYDECVRLFKQGE